MHPDLQKLISLQRLDVELKKLLDETTAIPTRLAALAARSAETQAALLTVEESLVREDTGRRGLELEVRTLNDRAARLGRQLDAATNEAQITALQHQLLFLATEVRRLEDDELASMERTEHFTAALPDRKQAVAAAESNLELARLSAADRGAWIGERTAELAEERLALRATVAEAALATYDRIAKSRGTALAEGVDGKCSACQMLVRPQRWNDLRDRSNDQLMLSCEHCGRLLYWDPARDAPQRPDAAAKKPVASAGSTPNKPQLGETKPADPVESIAARIVRGL